MNMEEDMIVMLVLKSLPVEFDQLKTTYTTQKDKWTLNELIAICVHKHERIKKVTIHLGAKLTALKMNMEEDMIMMLVLKSLPVEFDQLKTTYTTQKDKWTLNELIAICVQEHGRIKKVTIHLVTTKPQWKKPEKKASPSKNLGVGKKAMKVSGNKGGISELASQSCLSPWSS
ncbi:hypothetical protein ACLB2K_021909 [Fragaria x ananassa]